MADPRSRRTGEYNAQIIKLLADAVAMRERIDALEGRVMRLEAELSVTRKSPVPRPAGRRPASGGPPPLPPTGSTGPVMAPLSKPGGRKSIVDISEIAELVDSIPPPLPRSKR